MDNHKILQAAEVNWYRRFGRYPHQRIVQDGTRQLFVIGDWSWMRMAVPREDIEHQMSAWCRANVKYYNRPTSDRDRQIYTMRTVQGMTLQAVADEFMLSKERISQIVNKVEVDRFWEKKEAKDD